MLLEIFAILSLYIIIKSFCYGLLIFKFIHIKYILKIKIIKVKEKNREKIVVILLYIYIGLLELKGFFDN